MSWLDIQYLETRERRTTEYEEIIKKSDELLEKMEIRIKRSQAILRGEL